MEHEGQTRTDRQGSRPAAARDSQPTATAAFADNRPEALTQRELAETIDRSPRTTAMRALSAGIRDSRSLVAQRVAHRARLGGMSDQTAQLEGEVEGEEPPQGGLAPVLRVGADVEPPGGTVAPVQRKLDITEHLVSASMLPGVQGALNQYATGYDAANPKGNVALLQAILTACAKVPKIYRMYVEDMETAVARELQDEGGRIDAVAPPPMMAVPEAPPMLEPALDAPKPKIPPRKVLGPKESAGKGAPEFEKDLSGTSIGVEAELSGFVCALPENASRTFAFVKLTSTGEPLVMVTKDMGMGDYKNPKNRDYVKKPEKWKTHTVELVTYPAVRRDRTSVGSRSDAMKYLTNFFRLRLGSNNHEPLSDLISEDGRFTVEVVNAKHILATGTGDIADDDRVSVSMSRGGQQATMGIKAKDFGSSTDDDVKLIETAPWYKTQLKSDDAVTVGLKGLVQTDSPRNVQNVYAYLRSVIAQVASLLTEFNLSIEGYEPKGRQKANGLTDPQVKNKWQILPRTKPTVLLEGLTSTERQACLKAVREGKAIGEDQEAWKAALGYILGGGEVAGHGINDAKVGGEQALLFEFRQMNESLYDAAPADELPTTTVSDPLANLKSRSNALENFKRFAAEHGEEFKSWYVRTTEKFGNKSAAEVIKLATANQIAMWIKSAHAPEWERLAGETKG